MSTENSALAKIERVVSEIWAKDLAVPDIGPDSDFFEVGGDSLAMLNMLFHIKTALGVELPPGALFENSSLRAFSLIVERAAEREKSNVGQVEEAAVEGAI